MVKRTRLCNLQLKPPDKKLRIYPKVILSSIRKSTNPKQILFNFCFLQVFELYCEVFFLGGKNNVLYLVEKLEIVQEKMVLTNRRQRVFLKNFNIDFLYIPFNIKSTSNNMQ